MILGASGQPMRHTVTYRCSVEINIRKRLIRASWTHTNSQLPG
jgi:hypothetical protein